MMHIVCRKTKANAFGDFAYDFTEAISRNIESRKEVCFDTHQNYPIKGSTDEDSEAWDQYIIWSKTEMPCSENLGEFHTIRPILTHSYQMNKWSPLA